jgi:hypothetical protein
MIINGKKIGPGANLNEAELSGADLCRANLSGANLSGADLSGADLNSAKLNNTIGNSKEIKTIETEWSWTIVYTNKILCIGCESHTIESWFKFKDEDIVNMHEFALTFWKEWKPKLMSILELK